MSGPVFGMCTACGHQAAHHDFLGGKACSLCPCTQLVENPEAALDSRVTRCRTCRALILWCRTTTGSNMPVDARPVPGGNVVIDPTYDPPQARVVKPVQPPAGAYVSHFTTCPDAQLHRKAKHSRRDHKL